MTGVPPTCPALQRRRLFWWLLIPATVSFTIEPGLTLVLTALSLSTVTLFWIAVLVKFIVWDEWLRRRPSALNTEL